MRLRRGFDHTGGAQHLERHTGVTLYQYALIFGRDALPDAVLGLMDATTDRTATVHLQCVFARRTKADRVSVLPCTMDPLESGGPRMLDWE